MTLTVAGLKAALASAQGPSQDSSIQDSANQALAQAIITYLQSNAVTSVTIPPSAIVTNGSATTQAGPPAPVPLTGTLS